MSPHLMEIVRNSESRYFTAQEQREVLASAVEQVKRRYSSFERFHPKAWDKAARDMHLALRYTVQAMVCNDPDFQADRLLYWLGTIFHSIGFSPQFNRDTYAFMRDAVKASVPPDAFALLEPFLEKNIEVLGNMPEPAQVLV